MSTVQAPAPSLDSTMGAAYVGAVVTTAIWAAATIQCYNYYTDFRKDTWPLKSLVAVVWFLDTVTICFILMDPYYRLITHYGDTTFLSIKNTTINVEDQYILLGGIVCLFVQAFYVHRIWLVSKKNNILTAFLVVLILTEFGVRTTYYAKILPFHSLKQFSTQIKFFQASAALETAAGLLLAFVLIYYLQKSRTGFRRTESMINRIILVTIGTGLFPNIFAVLCFVFDVVQPSTNVHIALFQPVAQLYLISLLVTLRARIGGESTSTLNSEATSPAQSFTHVIGLHPDSSVKTVSEQKSRDDSASAGDEEKGLFNAS